MSSLDILYFCQTGNFTEVEKVLKKGICPNIQNSEGESPLQVAATYGYPDIVNLLLKSGALIDLPNNYGWTPLMHAARYGHTSTVALLLKMKAKVNILNKLGVSPVVAAAWSGDMSTVKLLIEAGAMVDLMPADNQNSECDLSTLMAVTLQGYEDILKFLLATGSNVHQTSPITGLSPLMLAACGGHHKIVKIIVEFGANVNSIDICGRSALDHAIECNKEEVITYLKSLSIPNPKNEDVQPFQNLPVVTIDSPDASVFDNSPSIRTSADFSPRKGFSFSSRASESGKLFFGDRSHSKRSHHETKVKEWIGGVAQHLQNKMFTHMSSRNSVRSQSLDVSFSDETMNEVFETQKSAAEESTSGNLKSSISLSPNQYLAKELKEHTVEAIAPPFPSSSYSKLIKSFLAKKENHKPKPSLQLPNLLKNYSKKKHSVCSNEENTKKGAAFITRAICDQNNDALHVSSSRADDSNYISAEFENEKVLGEVKINESCASRLELSESSQAIVQEDTNVNIPEGDLTVLLSKEALQKYAEKFRDQEVDINTFQQLTKDDLTDIGIQSSGSQKKLIELIKKLQNDN